MVVSNNKMKFSVVLKATGKPPKNRNCNVVSRIKNGNPSRAPISRKHLPPQRNDSPILTYFNCGKPTHMAKRCKSMPKLIVGSNAQVNLSDEKCIDMIIEINMVGGCDGWWIDNDASLHVCYDRAIFKTYTKVKDKKVLLGDAYTTNVTGIGDMELNFTSRKPIILKDAMHVPVIRNNIVSSFLLNKVRFSHSIWEYFYTISKNGIFVGK